MVTSATPQAQIIVRARAAAIAWYNAFLASGKDEERPLLYRTLGLEFFETGLQMIGCDGVALFRTWAPSIDHEGADSPALDEAPIRRAVVMDPEGFGLGYMRTLLRVTADEGHMFEPLTITTAPYDEEATLTLGTEFVSERLTLRACGQRTDLRLFEQAYPDWRALNLGVDAIERVDSLMIATRLFGLIGKLKCASAVTLDFHGDSRHIAFTARGEAEVRGLMMPMRKPEAQ